MAGYFPVTKQLGFGPAPRTARECDRLLSEGVTVVIDCQISAMPGRELGGRVTYHHVPIDDRRGDLPAWWFEKAGRLALAALKVPDARVFVCCAQGRRRSSALVYYLLRRQGVSAGETEATIRAARESVSTMYFVSAEAALK